MQEAISLIEAWEFEASFEGGQMPNRKLVNQACIEGGHFLDFEFKLLSAITPFDLLCTFANLSF